MLKDSRKPASTPRQNQPRLKSVDHRKGTRIHDHRSVYEQTFQPILSGVETLALWQNSFR